MMVNDNSKYIASARQQCLLIFAIGLISAQLAWSEFERQEAYDVFAYVEKALQIVSALGDVDEWSLGPPRNPSKTEGRPNIGGLIFDLARSMQGTTAVREITFNSPTASLATRADPTHSCELRAFLFDPTDGDSDDVRLALDIKTAAVAHSMQKMTTAKPGAAVLVGFSSFCPPVIRITDPILIVRYDGGTDQLGLVFSRRLNDLLGIDWERETFDRKTWHKIARDSDLLTPIQDERLADFDKPLLEALDLPLVHGLVLEAASGVSDRTYRRGDLDAAMKVILEGSVEQRDIWGLRVSPRTAVLLIPLAFLVLSFSLWHRVRRIDPKGALFSEPWIIVRPDGWTETMGAVIWILALIGIAVPISSAVLAYQGDDWPVIVDSWNSLWLYPANEADRTIGFSAYLTGFASSILESFLFWCLLANAAAFTLLLSVCWRLGRLNGWHFPALVFVSRYKPEDDD